MKKRIVDIVVLSDVHLGTYGCHAKELVAYLSTIKPKTLILNGDIIDIWQFRKSYFPKSHMKVVKRILDFAAKGTNVYYITGNHDEMLRKFSDTTMGNFSIVDKVVLEIDGKKAWFFHGDVFDNSVNHAKWIAKLGGIGYDYLILLNRFINWCLVKMGREPYSLSKKIKSSVKKAVKFISDFETIASDLAIENNYDYVVCGHIHEPKMVVKENKKGSVNYLNSGDWIENLTALEYNDQEWKLYRYMNEVEVDTEEEISNHDVKLENELMTALLFNRK
ncbi:UDP-2,3-diacylglucosamine diphosphatase [Flavobacterium sp. ST-75]|uniref:UDP-2,3-diacylglucosamine diphosphatase n=1 Tax=Flavobacterium rhizophilum TaxID=3163296 RepID=A0ABW8Y927_9FLAO